MPSTVDLSAAKPHLVQTGGTIGVARSFSLFRPPKSGPIVGGMTTADMPLAQDDVVVAFVFLEDASVDVDTTPAGWTLYDTQTDGGNLSCAIMWKVVSGQDVFNATSTADGTTGYSGGGNTTDTAGYQLALLRGVDPVTPFADGGYSSGASYTGTVTGPSVTPTATGAGFLDFVHVSDDGATFDVTGDTFAEVASTTGGTDGTRGLSFTMSTGTAGTPRALSVTGNQAGDPYQMYSLALNPLSSAASGLHEAEVTSLDAGTSSGGGSVTMPTGTPSTTLLNTTDTLLVAAGWVDSSSVQSTPAGWTDSGQGTFGAGTEKMRSAYKVRAGSETAVTELTNHNNGAAVLWMGQVAAVRNVDPNTPVNAAASGGATSSTTITLPDATTARPNSGFLVGVGVGDDGTVTIPAAWLPFVIGGGQTSQGNDGSMFWLLVPKTSPGSLSSLSLGTMTISANNWAAVTYALNAAPNVVQLATVVDSGSLNVATILASVSGGAFLRSAVTLGVALTTVLRRRSGPFRPRRPLVWVRDLLGVQENVIT